MVLWPLLYLWGTGHGLKNEGNPIQGFMWDTPSDRSVDSSFASCQADPEGEECWADLQMAFRNGVRLQATLNARPSMLKLIEDYIPYIQHSLSNVSYENAGKFVGNPAQLLWELMLKGAEPSQIVQSYYFQIAEANRSGRLPDFLSVKQHLFYPDSSYKYVGNWQSMQKFRDLAYITQNLTNLLNFHNAEMIQSSKLNLMRLNDLIQAFNTSWSNTTYVSMLADSKIEELRNLSSTTLTAFRDNLANVLAKIGSDILPTTSAESATFVDEVKNGVSEVSSTTSGVQVAVNRGLEVAQEIAGTKYQVLLKMFANKTETTDMLVERANELAEFGNLLKTFSEFNDSMIANLSEATSTSTETRLNLSTDIDNTFFPLFPNISFTRGFIKSLASNTSVGYTQDYTVFLANATYEKGLITNTLEDVDSLVSVLLDLHKSNERGQVFEASKVLQGLLKMFEDVREAVSKNANILASDASSGLMEQVGGLEGVMNDVQGEIGAVSSSALSSSSSQLSSAAGSMFGIFSMLSKLLNNLQTASKYMQAHSGESAASANDVLAAVNMLASGGAADLSSAMQEVAMKNRQNALLASVKGQQDLTKSAMQSSQGLGDAQGALESALYQAKADQGAVAAQTNRSVGSASDAVGSLTSLSSNLVDALANIVKQSNSTSLSSSLDDLKALARLISSSYGISAVQAVGNEATQKFQTSFDSESTAFRRAGDIAKTNLSSTASALFANVQATGAEMANKLDGLSQEIDTDISMLRSVNEENSTATSLLERSVGLFEDIHTSSIFQAVESNRTFVTNASAIVESFRTSQSQNIGSEMNAANITFDNIASTALTLLAGPATSIYDLLNQAFGLRDTATETSNILTLAQNGGTLIDENVAKLKNDSTLLDVTFQSSFPGNLSSQAEHLGRAVAELPVARSASVSGTTQVISESSVQGFAQASSKLDSLLDVLSGMSAQITTEHYAALRNSSQWSESRKLLVEQASGEVLAARAARSASMTVERILDAETKRDLMEVTASVQAALQALSQETNPGGKIDHLLVLQGLISAVSGTMALYVEAAESKLAQDTELERSRLDALAQSQLAGTSQKISLVGDQMLNILNGANMQAPWDPQAAQLAEELRGFSEESQIQLSQLLQKIRAGELNIDDAIDQASAVDINSIKTLGDLADAVIDAISVFQSRVRMGEDEAGVSLHDYSVRSGKYMQTIQGHLAGVSADLQSVFTPDNDRTKVFEPLSNEVVEAMKGDLDAVNKLQAQDFQYVLDSLAAAENVVTDLKRNLTSLETQQQTSVDEIVKDVKTRMTQRLRGRLGYNADLGTSQNLWSNTI